MSLAVICITRNGRNDLVSDAGIRDCKIIGFSLIYPAWVRRIMILKNCFLCRRMPEYRMTMGSGNTLEAGTAYRIALCQNRRFISLPVFTSGGMRTHDPTIIDKPVSPPSFRIERRLSHPNRTLPFMRKDRNTEIIIHVPHTRVKGAPPSLTPTN